MTFVEQRGGRYFVAGSEAPIDPVVCAFRAGSGAEAIQGQFPALTIEQVQGLIDYYLVHKDEVDRFLAAERSAFIAGGKTGSTPSLREQVNEAAKKFGGK